MCRRLAELLCSAKGYTDFEVGTGWSYLVVAGWATGFEFQLVRLPAAVGPPLPAVMPTSPFPSRRRLRQAYLFLVVYFAGQPAAVGAHALAYGLG